LSFCPSARGHWIRPMFSRHRRPCRWKFIRGWFLRGWRGQQLRLRCDQYRQNLHNWPDWRRVGQGHSD